jgi:hypothetical protein
MKTSLPKASRLKLAVFAVAVLLGAIGFLGPLSFEQPVNASASGPTPSHTAAPGEVSCTACHSQFPVNSGTGNIQIGGLPANYRAGQQIPITVTVSQADAVLYGFQLTAIGPDGEHVGSYTLPPANPQPLQVEPGIVGSLERQYVMHTAAGISSSVFGSKTWNFTWTAPATRVGKISFYAAGNGANSDGGPFGDHIYTTAKSTLSGSAIANFDGDIKSDISVFRPSTGAWYSLNTIDGGFKATQFGLSGDLIAPGDYDGDGTSDLAVFRPSTGVWYAALSSGGVSIVQWGLAGDIPVPGDYDGDLKNDFAVWRPSTGVWYILRSSDGGFDIRTFGLATDKPVQADFDGDGLTDVAVWRPSTGVWYIWRSTDNGYSIFNFGLSGDKPTQGDYDGDGRADAAVFRPSNGVWYILGSTSGFASVGFGLGTDVPAPADFDGDGKTDLALYRDGVWYIFRSSDLIVGIAGFGLPGDEPVPAGYLPD